MKLELTLQDKILQIGKNAKISSRDLARLNAKEKNEILFQIKKNLISNCEYILEENKKDMVHGREIGMSQGLLDRLLLNRQRIESFVLTGNKYIIKRRQVLSKTKNRRSNTNIRFISQLL